MRVVTEGLLAHMDLAASALARFQAHPVRPRVASQAIGTHHQPAVDGALPAVVPQAIAPRAMARGTPLTSVADDRHTAPLLAFTVEMGSAPLARLVDGVGQGLAVGRHPDSDGCAHA
jgi:hypothetical protein